MADDEGRGRRVRRAGVIALSAASVLVVSLLAVARPETAPDRGSASVTPTPSTSTTTSVAAAAAAGLAAFEFPEEADWRDIAGDAQRLERTVEREGHWRLFCPGGEAGVPADAEVLTVVLEGPEDGQARQLARYEDELVARKAVAQLRAEIDACDVSHEDSGVVTSRSWHIDDRPLGDGGFVAWTETKTHGSSPETPGSSDPDRPGGTYLLAVQHASFVI